MRFLIVEDDRTLAITIREILNNKNYETVVCYNYNQALNEINKTFDCYLLDNRLPDGTGLQLCKLIREYSTNPIIFISSDSTETSILKSFEYEADDYIEKPFRLNVLLAKIEAVLKRSGKYQSEFIIDNKILNSHNKTLKINNTIFDLSISETAILECLFRSYPDYVSRNDLCRYIFNKTGNQTSQSTLSTRISELKKKIGVYGNNIDSLRHIGIRWK